MQELKAQIYSLGAGYLKRLDELELFAADVTCVAFFHPELLITRRRL